jgi:hypothetical protein
MKNRFYGQNVVRKPETILTNYWQVPILRCTQEVKESRRRERRVACHAPSTCPALTFMHFVKSMV